MDGNILAALCLCSQSPFEKELLPFTGGEYRKLLQALALWDKTPKNLFALPEGERKRLLSKFPDLYARLSPLLSRAARMEAELRHYAAQGISIITLEDKLYPKGLKKHAPFPCPPLFYAVGDLNLGQKDCVGFVGSRNLNPEDIDFTKDGVRKVLSQGYGVVSGGARGIDTVAEQEAMLRGGFAVEFTAEALCQKLKNEDTLRNIREGRLLLLSAVAPTVGFSTGIAMMRNRFIYTHSQSTVVVHAATGKGGTWAGATDALKHHLCPVLCWDQNYEGNQSLIRQGATSIDSHWTGTLPQRAAFYGNAYPQGLTISQFPLYPVSFFPEDQQEESWDQNQLTLDELMSFEE